MLQEMKLIETEINKIGLKLINTDKTDRTNWTHEIKVFFLSHLKKKDLDLTVCIGDNKIKYKDAGEWLYDISAVKLQKNCEHMKYVDTIIESEWGNSDEVKEDFQKLLQSRARIKIMIFQDSEKEPYKRIRDILQTAINKYEDISNEELLHIFCWINNKELFQYEELRKNA